jgi:acetyl-CoA carboxylase biotin carboxyl carrier protein
MAEKTLIANVVKDETDPPLLVVASPVVGIADGALRKGRFLNPFDKILTVKVLNQRYMLRLPRDVQGRITEVYVPDRCTPVAYNEPIARLDPRAAEAPAGEGAAAAIGGHGGGELTDAGLIEVNSPTEGIFYRRPSPEAPPYVEAGSNVVTGTVLGLVEVMKCFNQIAYGGAGLPPKGEVVKVLAEDGAEVSFGQTLFRIKPL